MNFKKNDVFSFRYNPEEVKKRFEPYHCFDGTLVVKEYTNGQLYLEDTFWSSSENRIFTIDEAIKEGELKFICNLDDVEETQQWQQMYYDESDFITLYIHHGYRNQYFLKKDAKRSKQQMLNSLQGKLHDAERAKTNAEHDIISLKEKIDQVNQDNLTIYI